jgi:hypothetical protein
MKCDDVIEPQISYKHLVEYVGWINLFCVHNIMFMDEIVYGWKLIIWIGFNNMDKIGHQWRSSSWMEVNVHAFMKKIPHGWV